MAKGAVGDYVIYVDTHRLSGGPNPRNTSHTTSSYTRHTMTRTPRSSSCCHTRVTPPYRRTDGRVMYPQTAQWVTCSPKSREALGYRDKGGTGNTRITFGRLSSAKEDSHSPMPLVSTVESVPDESGRLPLSSPPTSLTEGLPQVTETLYLL